MVKVICYPYLVPKKVNKLPKISVHYDLDHEIFVYKYFSRNLSDYALSLLKNFLSEEIFTELKTSNFQKTENLKKFLKEYEKDNSQRINKAKELTTKIWQENSQDIVKELRSLYKVEITHEIIDIYLITFPKCPYNDKEGWFTVNLLGSKDSILQTIKHELNHFYFHQKFKEDETGLSEDEYFLIKEAFTVITLPNENGYQGHEDLRAKIKGWYEEGSSVEEIFERCVEVVKV